MFGKHFKRIEIMVDNWVAEMVHNWFVPFEIYWYMTHTIFPALHKKSFFPILFTISYLAFTLVIVIFLIFVQCSKYKMVSLLFPYFTSFFLFFYFLTSLFHAHAIEVLAKAFLVLRSVVMCSYKLQLKSHTVEGSW